MDLLVVDGDLELSGQINDMLVARGVHVTTTDSSEGLFTHLATQTPSLILLCVELPERKGAGYLACNKLKKDDRWISIPVVLTSDSATEEDFDKHRKLKTAADAYLHKPFTDDDLFRKMEDLAGFKVSSAEFEDLQAQVHDFLNERADLEGRIRELQDQLIAAENALTQAVETQEQVANQQLAEEEAKLDDLLGQVASAARTLESTRSRLQEAEQKAQELASANEAQEQALASRQARVAALDERLVSLDATVDERQSNLETLQENESKLVAQIADYEQTCEEALRRKTALADDVAALDTQVGSANDNLGMLQRSIEGAEARLATLQEQQAAGTQVVEQYRTLGSQVAKVESLHKKIAEQMSQLLEQMSYLEDPET